MYLKNILAFCIGVLLLVDFAFMQEYEKWPVVFRLPRMEDVEVRSVTFKTLGDGVQLKMYVFYPPDINHRSRLPAVIFHNCQSMDNIDYFLDYGKLIAASGMVGIIHQSRFFEKEDSGDLIDYISLHADELSIDASQMGIWTASGNTMIGVPLALEKDKEYFRCAVVYYGMPDPETIDLLKPLRQDISLFIVRCGLDEFRANRNIDYFVSEALDADMDFELVNYLTGHHAFDIADDNERSREIIRRTLNFFRANLIERKKPEASIVFTSKKFHAMLRDGQIEETKTLFDKKLAEMQADQSNTPFFHREIWERGMVLTAQQLLGEGKNKESAVVLQWMLEAYPHSPAAHLGAAEGFYDCGEVSLAIQIAEKAIELSHSSATLNEEQKKKLQESAAEKIKKWKGAKAM